MTDAASLSVNGLWVLWMAMAGACVGSFLNVMALYWPARLKAQWNRDVAEFLDRTPESLGIDAGPPPGGLIRRSRCPHCGTTLGWWQLIPLFSFLMLRGRCHHCKTRISWRYPAVEACTALLFSVVAWQQPPGWAAALSVTVLCVLILLTLIDLDEMLLPDDLTLPLLWLGLVHAAWLEPDALQSRVIGAVAGYLSLWTVFHIFRLATGREGMGHGDFKLLAALGAWMGWPALLPIILLASICGSLWGLVLLARRHIDQREPFPFGPWLALAGALQWLSLNPAGIWLQRLL